MSDLVTPGVTAVDDDDPAQLLRTWLGRDGDVEVASGEAFEHPDARGLRESLRPCLESGCLPLSSVFDVDDLAAHIGGHLPPGKRITAVVRSGLRAIRACMAHIEDGIPGCVVATEPVGYLCHCPRVADLWRCAGRDDCRPCDMRRTAELDGGIATWPMYLAESRLANLASFALPGPKKGMTKAKRRVLERQHLRERLGWQREVVYNEQQQAE